WKSRYAAGAMLTEVPGCPEPAASTASIASPRMTSTASPSMSVHSMVVVLAWATNGLLTFVPSEPTQHRVPAHSPDSLSGVSVRAVVSSYVALTKPRIIELLLVTTIPVMMLAARGWPSTWTLAVTLVGGTLAAGSANTINCVVDRDIDAVMGRTKRRPVVLAAISPTAALRFGLVLGMAATLLLGLAVNWLSAVLAVGAILFYVFVYTLGLKRRTPSNIVIGGAAGCFPVLIGWSAVRGNLGWP